MDGSPIIKLPARRQRMLKHRLSASEQQFYSDTRAECVAEIERMKAAGGASSVGYTNMLMMLLKLRQAASHPWLVARHGSEDAAGELFFQLFFFVYLFALRWWFRVCRVFSLPANWQQLW